MTNPPVTHVLADRIALVTGSSRGIGAAIAAEFARRGAAVAVHGRDHAAATATPMSPIEDITEDSWRATVDGNLLATLLTIACFPPGMKHRGRGSIITLGSSAGRRADERVPAPYGVAKAGIALAQGTRSSGRVTRDIRPRPSVHGPWTAVDRVSLLDGREAGGGCGAAAA